MLIYSSLSEDSGGLRFYQDTQAPAPGRRKTVQSVRECARTESGWRTRGSLRLYPRHLVLLRAAVPGGWSSAHRLGLLGARRSGRARVDDDVLHVQRRTWPMGVGAGTGGFRLLDDPVRSCTPTMFLVSNRLHRRELGVRSASLNEQLVQLLRTRQREHGGTASIVELA